MNYKEYELYELLITKKFLAKGTRGIILINDEDTLIKIPKELSTYSLSFNDFKESIEYLKIQKNNTYEENQKKFMNLKTKYEFIEFARQIIYVDKMYIGILMKWYKNYKNIMNFEYKNNKELLEVFEKIIEYNNILINNGVYHLDLIPKNILYNGQTIKIIDIDGPGITYDEKHNKNYEYSSYYTIFTGLYALLKKIFIDDENYIDRKYEYILLIQSEKYKNLNYEKSKELLNTINNKGIFTKWFMVK